MAITWTEDADSRQVLGPSGIVQVNIANFASSDYVTGGYPILPIAFGLARIRGAWSVGSTAPAQGYRWEFDSSTTPPRLKAMTGINVEAAAGTNLAPGTVRIMAYGY